MNIGSQLSSKTHMLASCNSLHETAPGRKKKSLTLFELLSWITFIKESHIVTHLSYLNNFYRIQSKNCVWSRFGFLTLEGFSFSKLYGNNSSQSVHCTWQQRFLDLLQFDVAWSYAFLYNTLKLLLSKFFVALNVIIIIPLYIILLLLL